MNNAPPNVPRVKCKGLFVKKEIWVPSLKGAIFLLAGLLSSLAIAFFAAYPFLAVTDKVDSDVLVIEGWIPLEALKAGLQEFNRGSNSYTRVITTGCWWKDESRPNEKLSYAHRGARRLIQFGLSPDKIEAVPCWQIKKDRTYSSAVALQKWASEQKVQLKSINIVTVGPHARRTRLLFQKALRGKVRCGVIPVQVEDYDQKWWNTSQGVREIVGESIAYPYARFLFFPSSSAAS